MDPTTLGVVTIVIGAVVALLVGCATVWAARRYGSHRGRLDIDVRNVQIVGRARLVDLGSGHEFATEPVEDSDDDDSRPAVHIVQLRIRNRGFHDIAAEAFGGKPLVLSLGGAGVEATGNVSYFGVPFIPPPQTGSRKIDIGPLRIARRVEWGCAIFTCGDPPRISIHSPIKDVDIKVKIHKPRVAGPGIVFDLPELYGYKKPGYMSAFRGNVHPY